MLNYQRVYIWLVVWNMFYDFLYIGQFIIPTDELIFFRGVEPTNQYIYYIYILIVYI